MNDEIKVIEHEIQWIQNKIETLKPRLEKKPSVSREIKDLERQISERVTKIEYLEMLMRDK